MTVQPTEYSAAFARDGVAVIPQVLGEQACMQLESNVGLSTATAGSPGSRNLLAQDWCAALLPEMRAHPAVAAILPASHVAVQCTYFEKSRATNWLVPIHQDLSIPVQRRVDHPALTGWSDKEGQCFVQAPLALLQQLVALRVHIDDCADVDGPLRVVAGSHTQGLISAQQAPSIRSNMQTHLCVVQRGGIVAMRPLVLHASSKATGSGLRRVLHFVFGPASLPYGLQWALSV